MFNSDHKIVGHCPKSLPQKRGTFSRTWFLFWSLLLAFQCYFFPDLERILEDEFLDWVLSTSVWNRSEDLIDKTWVSSTSLCVCRPHETMEVDWQACSRFSFLASNQDLCNGMALFFTRLPIWSNGRQTRPFAGINHTDFDFFVSIGFWQCLSLSVCVCEKVRKTYSIVFKKSTANGLSLSLFSYINL